MHSNCHARRHILMVFGGSRRPWCDTVISPRSNLLVPVELTRLFRLMHLTFPLTCRQCLSVPHTAHHTDLCDICSRHERSREFSRRGTNNEKRFPGSARNIQAAVDGCLHYQRRCITYTEYKNTKDRDGGANTILADQEHR
jgi:hypothetical protein